VVLKTRTTKKTHSSVEGISVNKCFMISMFEKYDVYLQYFSR